MKGWKNCMIKVWSSGKVKSGGNVGGKVIVR